MCLICNYLVEKRQNRIGFLESSLELWSIGYTDLPRRGIFKIWVLECAMGVREFRPGSSALRETSKVCIRGP